MGPNRVWCISWWQAARWSHAWLIKRIRWCSDSEWISQSERPKGFNTCIRLVRSRWSTVTLSPPTFYLIHAVFRKLAISVWHAKVHLNRWKCHERMEQSHFCRTNFWRSENWAPKSIRTVSVSFYLYWWLGCVHTMKHVAPTVDSWPSTSPIWLRHQQPIYCGWPTNWWTSIQTTMHPESFSKISFNADYFAPRISQKIDQKWLKYWDCFLNILKLRTNIIAIIQPISVNSIILWAFVSFFKYLINFYHL